MITKPATVTGLLLAVAILSFSALAYQTVPVSTTRTLGVGVYSQTVTTSIMESSTSLVPVFVTLGLTDSSFTALAIVVVSFLTILTIWMTLKSRKKTTKGAN